MLTHHKLKVYQTALVLAASAEEMSACWGKRHAVVDHFRRASESIVLNIAQGSRLFSGPGKAGMLDYAVGSALECAACLDIARIKELLSMEQCGDVKRRILEVVRMLIGLRKAWLGSAMREESSAYQAAEPEPEVLFHHETLDVYQVSLEFMGWFVRLPGGRQLADRRCQEIDRAASGIILNVAEGNGRYSALDHRRFLEIAVSSAVRAAAHLDLYQAKAHPGGRETMQGRELLSRIVAMLNRF